MMPRWAGVLAVLVSFSSQAATYYVRSGGDDNADGLSDQHAWASLGRVNQAALKRSDRVLLREGDRFVGRLVVDWGGTASAPAVIGAYYVKNGVATQGYASQRPTIDGDDKLPSQDQDALVAVKADYVRLEGLNVVNSEGRGISFGNAQYGVVSDCATDNTYKSGIKFVNAPHALVVGSRVSRSGMAYAEDGGNWGGSIEFVASSDSVARRNVVKEVYGEGINANHGSANVTIEENVVFGARAVGIYLDTAPNATVRRNLVLGTANNEYWRDGNSVGAGIALNNELYHYQGGGALDESVQSRGARIYGNLVAFTTSGLGFWGKLPATSFDDVLVYNNTFVDNDTQITMRDKPKPGAKLVNNILLSVSASARDVDTSAGHGMLAKNNYFSKGDPGGDLSHPGNRYSGIKLGRMSGWRTIDDLAKLRWQDFAPAQGAAVVGAGDSEPQSTAQGDDSFDRDYNGMPHNRPMDIGALHFGTVSFRKPKTPTGVLARP